MLKQQRYSKQNLVLVLTTMIFIVGSLILFIPAVKISSAANTSIFNVSLTLSNVAPVVTWVQATTNVPADGTTKIISLQFNASDGNGVIDIPASNAKVTINKSGTSYASSTCAVNQTSGTTNMYYCNITINYYDPAGTWTINASVFDGGPNQTDNLTTMYTMQTLYAIQIKTTTMTFSGNPGSTVSASNNPQFANNTGNGAFTYLNVTAYDMLSGPNLISAGNFTVNTTSASASGQTMLNNTMVKLQNSSLQIGNLTNMYLYLAIPTGTVNGNYQSNISWIITAG